jgi:hypothetical protein
MDTFLLIVEFFGGLILLFALFYLIGHLLKLGKYSEDFQNNKKLIPHENKS